MAGSIEEMVKQVMALTLPGVNVSSLPSEKMQEIKEKFPGCLTELAIEVFQSTTGTERIEDFRKKVKKEVPWITEYIDI